MHTSAECLGLLSMLLQINFYCFTFGVSTDGDQAEQLSTDSPRQAAALSIIHRPSPRNKHRQPKGHAGEGGAA